MNIPEIVPTDAQSRAISAIRKWFGDGYPDQQVFRLFGFAGTGKTTIIKYVIGDLGLRTAHDCRDETEIPEVVFAAFTGKAASVMRRNSLPATTIHSLIYKVTIAPDEVIEQEELALADMERSGASKIAIREQKEKIKNLTKPGFRLNSESTVCWAKLIVLDEVSMVDETLAADILSFGVPVLVIGDPGQLPPIEGPGYFITETPDVMLTQIHRQVFDSPILLLATLARLGKKIPYGNFGDGINKVEKVHKRSTYLIFDQVICGRNNTRFSLNRMMRKEVGLEGRIPSGEREKIICLSNDHPSGLINGMFLTLRNISEYREHWILAEMSDEDNEIIRPQNPYIYNGHFLNHFEFDKDRIDREWKSRRGFIEATYGWAITCHKAQGSQWPSVLVLDESSFFRADRHKWLYTAITRAETRLAIVG